MKIIYVGDSTDVVKRIRTNHCRGNVEASALRRYIAEDLGYRIKREKRVSGSTRIRIDLPNPRKGEERVSEYIRGGRWKIVVCPDYGTAHEFQWYAIQQLNPSLNRERRKPKQDPSLPKLLEKLTESPFLKCEDIHEVESGPGVYVLYHQRSPFNWSSTEYRLPRIKYPREESKI